jgi:hypothetical protein
MKSTCFIFFIPLLIVQIIFLALPLYSAEEDLFKENRERGIAFISGGVSQTEREILKERGKGYTLKLIFSSKKGEYFSNVIVKVFDQKNRNILLTVSNGPWIFIDLPNGIYKIEASFRAYRKRISQIKIERGKQKVFHLRWQLMESPESR